MLGSAGGCVAVLIFTLTYHLGGDGVGGSLLSLCCCSLRMTQAPSKASHSESWISVLELGLLSL